MEITLLEESDVEDYGTFLSSHPHAMVYYTLPYRNLLQELLGARADYWIARENGQIWGVLPLMARRGTFGDVINSLPYYGSHGGVLASAPEARDLLVKKLRDVTEMSGVAASIYVANPWADDNPVPTVKDCLKLEDYRIAQMTPLSISDPSCEKIEDDLFGCFDSSARRNIRKARKDGVEVTIENDALEFLEATHVENMAAMGGNAKSSAFFSTLPKNLMPERDYLIYVARREGTPVSALLILRYGTVVEYFMPVTVGEHRNSQPMAAILIKAMCDAASQGYKWWNWGGTWPTQEGVYRFKKKWGAVESRYEYHICVRNRALLRQTKESLLSAYPGFYTVPFDRLEGDT